MTSTRPVLVGIDGSEGALQALRWAAADAARRAVPLRLATVFAWSAPPPPRHVRHGAVYRDILHMRARDQLTAAAELAAELAPSVPVETVMPTGHPIAELVTMAAAARLLVVGGCGTGPVPAVIGSVAVALPSRSPCPTVVVRGHDGTDPASAALPVLVGVDDGDGSAAAIGFAFEEAASRQVELVAVHAVEDTLLTNGDLAVRRRTLEERLAQWTEKFPGVRVRPAVTDERPTARLLADAAGAQLLVVGSRGRGGIASLALGSVSSAAVRHSPCPVAVVRS